MKQYRKQPAVGEVVAIRLEDGRWVYACRAMDVYYFYKYVTQGIITDHALFSKNNWIKAVENCVSISDRWPREFPTVMRIELTADEELPWRLYKGEKILGDPDSGRAYWIYNGFTHRQISDREAKMYPWRNGIGLAEIPKFLEQFRSEMVEIKGSSVDLELAPEFVAAKVVIELDYHGGQISVEAEDIEEAVTAAAEAAELDLEVLEAEVYAVIPEDLPLAKRVLRKALKSVFPEEEWPFVYVLIKGPRVGQSRRFDLVPKPKSKSQ